MSNVEVKTFWDLQGLEKLVERKIYYIDVGALPPWLAKKYVNKIVKRYKEQ